MTNKVLRVNGNPNNPKDWENCSGDPDCPRHVHIDRAIPSSMDALIKYEVEKEILSFLQDNPPTLEEKNRHETHSIFATIIPAATVGIASAGGAIYTAVEINGGPIYYGTAIGLGLLFGAMSTIISGIAAHYSHKKAVINLTSQSLINKYQQEKGTKLSKEEQRFIKQNISLEITDEDHKQNQLNALAEQEELNRKFLEEYNSPSKKS